jgi:GNAT superfamily N-acetyltransferase
VRRDARRRGVGRALVTAALEWAHAAGAKRAQLLMDTSNAAAEAFYARIGWDTTQLAARRISLRK